MIGTQTVIGVIPARGKSTRLPGKNLLPIAGRPMIAWTIAAARNSKYLDRLIVSTDDPLIAETAHGLDVKVPFLRPAELSNDEASSEAVLLHALDAIGGEYAIAVLLQPTSPLCLGTDIDMAIETCIGAKASACVSVCISPKPLGWLMTKNTAGQLFRVFEPRAVPDPVYLPNGAVFVVDISTFRKHKTFYPTGTVPSIMPLERSIDVDSEVDLIMADALLRRQRDQTTS